MKQKDIDELASPSNTVRYLIPLMFVGTSLTAIVAAFALANSSYEFGTKTKGFSAIIFGYLIFSGIAYWKGHGNLPFIRGEGDRLSDEQLESRLFSIEEASVYFGGSLKSSDMFRLMASRVDDLVPFDSCVLFMVDGPESKMRIVQADGENARKFKKFQAAIDGGLAARARVSGMVQIDRGLSFSDRGFPNELVANFKSSAALPLSKNGEVFAVVQLFSRSKTAFDGNSITLLEAIGERVAPMVLSAVSFENSLSSALTDPLTELPNERAFYLILENQIAEAQRNREGRPVSILTLDIKNFNEVNETYGHAAGDRLLNFAAQKIKEQLRQMDFFARASNDEFLVIMPTATAKVAHEIVSRIENEFVGCRFSVSQKQSVEIELSFGLATFWHDGETAPTLLAVARERKEQTKTGVSPKVVWFPRKYAN